MLNLAQIENGNQKNQKFKRAVQKVMGKLLIGVKIRNLKVDFKTGGTWRRVGLDNEQ